MKYCNSYFKINKIPNKLLLTVFVFVIKPSFEGEKCQKGP